MVMVVVDQPPVVESPPVFVEQGPAQSSWYSARARRRTTPTFSRAPRRGSRFRRGRS